MMAVQLAIPYATLVELVRQLPDRERHDLLRELQAQEASKSIAGDDWQVSFDALLISRPVGAAFLLNRADWYDDDGR